jgi:hypothetical protein
MTKKKVFFQETRGDKYNEGWLELEVHPIGDLKKQEKVK